MRPWKATPEEEEREGAYCDYAAFERWFFDHIDDLLPYYEEGIWGSLSTTQQVHLYTRLARSFDDLDKPVENQD